MPGTNQTDTAVEIEPIPRRELEERREQMTEAGDA